jgi:hypothetical protein
LEACRSGKLPLARLLIDLNRVGPEVVGPGAQAAVAFAQVEVLEWLASTFPSEIQLGAAASWQVWLEDAVSAANAAANPAPATDALREVCDAVVARQAQTAFWIVGTARTWLQRARPAHGAWAADFSTSLQRTVAAVFEVLAHPQTKTAKVLADPLARAFWVLCATPNSWGTFIVRVLEEDGDGDGDGGGGPGPEFGGRNHTLTVEFCQGDRVLAFHFRDMVEQKIRHDTWLRVENRRPVAPVKEPPRIWDDAADSGFDMLFARCTSTDNDVLRKVLTDVLAATTTVTSTKMLGLLERTRDRTGASETVRYLCRNLLRADRSGPRPGRFQVQVVCDVASLTSSSAKDGYLLSCC